MSGAFPCLNWPRLPRLPQTVGYGCAAFVATLLLLQPLLCVVTCLSYAHGHAAHGGHQHHHEGAHTSPQGSPGAADPASPAPLCPYAAIAGVAPLPAFWPGLLPAMPTLLALVALLHGLVAPGPARLSSRHSAPPLPPPRPAA